ncbi:MAG: hypothetical protein AB4426_12830 [Xenococcaceae cyanobacterium]
MNDIPRQKLQELIATYSHSLCDEPQRCEALLRDFCGQYRREISVLIGALKEGVVKDLITSLGSITSPSTIPQAILLARLTKRLKDNLALTEEAADWGVQSWALALGVISSTEALGRHIHEVSPPEKPSQLLPLVETVYRFTDQTVPLRDLKLNFKKTFADTPPEPFWYKQETELLKEYIAKTDAKPILLTGYGSFGGTYLAEWAIKKAANELSEQMGVPEETVVIQITADLVGRGTKGLWVQIDQWIIEVWHRKLYRKLKQRFHDTFQQLLNHPIYELQKVIETDQSFGIVVRTPKFGAKVKFPVVELQGDIGSIDGRHERKSERTYEPRPRQEQLFRLLRNLAYALPSEPENGLAKFLSGIRNSGIPYRIVLLLDKINKISDLKYLDELFQIRGVFRVISIIDKYKYNRWTIDEQDRLFLERNFELVKCLPIWDESIAQKFCEHYFDLSKISNDNLFLDFSDGINFFCNGVPGEFLKIINKMRLPQYINESQDDQKQLTLPKDCEMIKQCQLAGKIERHLAKEWEVIMGDFLPTLFPNDIINEQKARARRFLNSLLKSFIMKNVHEITKEQFLNLFLEEFNVFLEEFNVDSSILEKFLPAICDRLISSLTEGKILEIVEARKQDE